MLEIKRATSDDLDQLTGCFNLYRGFYKQVSNELKCREFLSDRLVRNESVIFIVNSDEVMAGFVQLYPCFSSISLKRQWILNDLFVKEKFRRLGVAKMLLKQAGKFGKADLNCKGLTLKTGSYNFNAQKLYESMNWLKEVDYISYNLDE